MEHEVTDVGNDSCVVVKHPSFWHYVGDKGEFMRLGLKDREKIFLRWKHGSKDTDANMAVDMTDAFLLSRIRQYDISNLKEFEKGFWQREMEWDEKCKVIKFEIGLLAHEDRSVIKIKTKDTEKVADMFGGKVVKAEPENGWDE